MPVPDEEARSRPPGPDHGGAGDRDSPGSSVGAVVETDNDGHVTFLDPTATQLTGLSAEDARGRTLGEVFRILDERTRTPRSAWAQRPRRHEGGRARIGQGLLVSRNGAEHPVEYVLVAKHAPDGEVSGWTLAFRDTTEMKASRDATARLAALVESSDDAILSKSLDGVIRSWNRAAERLFGYAAPEAVGRHVSLVIPPELAEEEDHILQRIRRGKRVDHYETVRLARDGRRIDVSLTVSPILDEAGEVVAASTIARDITELKRIRRELVARTEQLAEADRRKDEFIALLAHELRNPLAPLRTGLQVLRLATDPATIARTRTMMERQLGHVVRLIDDLLDVSRLDRRKLHLKMQRVALADVLRDAIDAAGPALAEARHAFSMVAPAEPVLLWGDPTRLAQVVENLLVNAAKYTDPGGHVWLTAEANDREVVIAVRDDGLGLPPDAVSRIFEVFAQVDRAAERSRGGLGLGLALVRGIVEMHHGTVEAASPGPGRGSTFTVRLPRLVDDAAHDAPERPEEPRPDTVRRHRVLVVDDNRDAADALAAALTLLGHDVYVAHDGLAAVDQAEVHRPDLVLMDIGLPGLDGLEATRRIRARPWSRDVRIYALTGWGQDRDRERSREAGCDGHLVKPVGLDELERVLATLPDRP